MTKDEGKVEVLNAFLASGKLPQTSCSLGIHSTELENKDASGMKSPSLI